MRTCLLTGLILAAASAPAFAIECPIPARIDDPAIAKTVQEFLPAGIDLRAPDVQARAVYDLRQAGVAPDIILDNLIAAYCSAVAADASASNDEKTQRVKTYARTASQLVYGSGN